MKRRSNTKRQLAAEALEGRQLLHGGAMTGGGEPPTTAERVEGVFERFDANEDAQISVEESGRAWRRLSVADADENSVVTPEELTTHLENLAAERADQDEGDGDEGGEDGDRARERDRDRNRGRQENRQRGQQRVTLEERIDSLFTENDTNEDNVLTEDEVSERLWARISDADTDGDGVSTEDLLARDAARRQARFDASFDRLDANDDETITQDEVPERVWNRISEADGDDEGEAVSAQELMDYLAAQRAERQAEQNENDDGSEENEMPAVEGEGTDNVSTTRTCSLGNS